jgi:Tol biopolymer transport system component
MFSSVASPIKAQLSADSEAPRKAKIAFMSDEGGESLHYQIWTMDNDGTNRQRLTDPMVYVWFGAQYPAWSPDGRKIIFDAWAPNPSNWRMNIFVMNADGSNQTRLTNNTRFDVYYRYPSWSPDGRKILFNRTASVSRGAVDLDQIFVMDANGSNETNITNSSTVDQEPVWSPDGSRIAFVRRSPVVSVPGEIYVMTADGSDQVQLTTTIGADNDFPAWSPDGTKIVFSRQLVPSTHSNIYVMNADGSMQTRLTIAEATEVCPTWSPDGTRITFVRGRIRFFMDADGSNQVPLSQVAHEYGPGRWQIFPATH